jgi:hypothetical protein
MGSLEDRKCKLEDYAKDDDNFRKLPNVMTLVQNKIDYIKLMMKAAKSTSYMNILLYKEQDMLCPALLGIFSMTKA